MLEEIIKNEYQMYVDEIIHAYLWIWAMESWINSNLSTADSYHFHSKESDFQSK